ncbi:MAG: Uma2 family endonuclease [Deltaproteobacteria bacterium]|nr:Uma2 family endonuclease [Deltaproteobacteria bacterium]
MGDPARKQATYEDVLNAPPNRVAELIHGVLHLHPRPAARHAGSSSSLGGLLSGPFRFGRGGPGGWIILDEPELHLGRHVLVPDLAGWRRERMPELPDAPFLEVPPNWACEVLSPSTAALDRGEKMPLYAAQGVTHVWLIDPVSETLEVYRLDGATYRAVATHVKDAVVHAEPFDAIELALADQWAR